MTRQRAATQATNATRTVVVTQAQLEFLVQGDLTRLAAIGGLNLRGGTADAYALAVVTLEVLVSAWVDVFGDDRRPGGDCEIPAWTPALAALAARRAAAAEAVTQAMLDTTDYFVFGRPVRLRSLLASVMGPETPDDPAAGGPVPTADPRVTRVAADLQRLGAAYDVADAEYREAVRDAVADAPPLTPPRAQRPTEGLERT